MTDYIPNRILVKRGENKYVQGTIIFMDNFCGENIVVFAELDNGDQFVGDIEDYCFIEDFFAVSQYEYLSNDLH